MRLHMNTNGEYEIGVYSGNVEITAVNEIDNDSANIYFLRGISFELKAMCLCSLVVK